MIRSFYTINSSKNKQKLQKITSFLTIAIASSILALVSVFTYSLPAAAASTQQICDFEGTGKCLALQGNLNVLDQPIVMETRNPGAAQNLNDFFHDTCNGGHVVVTSPTGCPFTNGSGLNSEFKGMPIVTLQWNSYTACLGVESSMTGSVTNEDCSGSNAPGTIWVQSGHAFINRAVSDTDQVAAYLCAGSSSDSVTAVAPFEENYCQWNVGQ